MLDPMLSTSDILLDAGVEGVFGVFGVAGVSGVCGASRKRGVDLGVWKRDLGVKPGVGFVNLSSFSFSSVLRRSLDCLKLKNNVLSFCSFT